MQDRRDDADLLARIGAGDQIALRTLIGRYQVRVFRFILRIVRREAVAEELVNEVFVEVWRKAQSFESRSAVSTWLLGIAHHKALGALRRRREEAWNEDEAQEIMDEQDDPEVVTLKSDKGAALRRCLGQLSAEHREIVDLVYYHDKSVGEASAIVGIPEGTVKTRLFTARKRLSELMLAAGIDRGWP